MRNASVLIGNSSMGILEAPFYKLPVNADEIELIEERWTVPEYTMYKEIKIKNFMGGKEINWKLKA